MSSLCWNRSEDLPLTLTVDQVADVLGISRTLAYNLVKKEGLAVRVGEKRLVIPKARLLNFLKAEDNLLSEVKQ